MLPEQTAWLEERCDEVNATLAPLKSFVLPGGTPAAAQLHVCRTVCRRAERRAIACGDEINAEVVRYLNRLSDLLFILSRGANGGEEPLWEPGRYRDQQRADQRPRRSITPVETATPERRDRRRARPRTPGAAA